MRPMLAPTALLLQGDKPAPDLFYPSHSTQGEAVQLGKKRAASPLPVGGQPTTASSETAYRATSADTRQDFVGQEGEGLKSAEPISSEISLDNLVEGSRRKRNKFGNDLPLLPFPIHDASSHYGASVLASMPHEHYHGRSYSMSQIPARQSSGMPFGGGHHHTPSFASLPGRVSFPTPAPTTISDEDVAMQLIRLGDPSLSPFKCPSEKSSSPVPALQTALQLKAMHDGIDPAQAFLQHQQQSGATIPSTKREMTYPSSPPSSLNEQQQEMQSAMGSRIGYGYEELPVQKARHRASSVTSDGTVKEELEAASDEVDIPRPQNLPKLNNGAANGFDFAQPAGTGRPPKQDGRSIGVRCTRCKKSKKGCDRQRPCGRCADAGEDCVTEDEGSGRGRTHRGNGRKKRV
ncbi:hypothetical protein BCR37DRAFT_385660 [Protomyces lactucae-debilis]|uniref:Zn(2)-C6 fungal-type domain-containing protein n=1 Tax=Protomyces lactucae-debilis TaxID=2754530 RepID=A0A1Y2FQC1_PROLT|nr:uncharacterized protein BCR37DRAFT_385660 [Protomyces lactucae-debilis]ORY86178.1 hypothetical protein BCR37DRAFT_385660 [Protomyces lactucae-debilis]